jgi:ferredoxin
MALVPGSKEYQYYYNLHPELKEEDDAIRIKPHLCSPGTATYDPVLSKIADANFEFLAHIRKLSEGETLKDKTEIDTEYASNLLKDLALHYGAVKVGIVKLHDGFFYSHRGRHRENYGDLIHNHHSYGIVFAVEMSKEIMNRSPQVASVMETSKAYVDAAIVGMQLSYYLRELGYEARNHMDGYYLLHCISMAYEAGIGEIGRNGLMTTSQHGSRIRLGVVTTNLELKATQKSDFGLKELCIECKRCIRTCPGKAISSEEDINTWVTDQQKCYNRWRSLGTDCGICISVCPISQDSISDLLKTKEDHGKSPF